MRKENGVKKRLISRLRWREKKSVDEIIVENNNRDEIIRLIMVESYEGGKKNRYIEDEMKKEWEKKGEEREEEESEEIKMEMLKRKIGREKKNEREFLGLSLGIWRGNE